MNDVQQKAVAGKLGLNNPEHAHVHRGSGREGRVKRCQTSDVLLGEEHSDEEYDGATGFMRSVDQRDDDATEDLADLSCVASGGAG